MNKKMAATNETLLDARITNHPGAAPPPEPLGSWRGTGSGEGSEPNNPEIPPWQAQQEEDDAEVLVGVGEGE